MMYENMGLTMVDRITGFRGVAIGYCQYLTDCSQVLLAPRTDDPTKRPDAHWIDIQRLDVVTDIARVVIDNGAGPGADKPAPVR